MDRRGNVGKCTRILERMRIDGLVRTGRGGTIFGICSFMNNGNFEIVIGLTYSLLVGNLRN